MSAAAHQTRTHASKAHADKANPAKESLHKEQNEQRKAEREGGHDAELQKALEDTFPASDPVASQTATKPGAKKRD